MKIGKRRFWLIPLTGVLALFAWLGFSFSHLHRPGTAPTKNPIYAEPGTTITGTRVIFWDHAQRSVELQADRIGRSTDGLTMSAENVHEGLVYDKGEVVFHFTARSVRYESISKRFAVSGGITVSLDDGTVIKTDEAEVDMKHKTMSAPGGVRIDGPDISLVADSLTADLDTQVVTLKGNITGTWQDGELHVDEATYCLKDGAFTIQGSDGEGVELTL